MQGIGAAIVAPAGLSLLVTSWPEERARSHALGVYGSGRLDRVRLGRGAGRPPGAGELAAGVLRQRPDRRAPARRYRLLPASAPTRKGGLDLPGAVTGTAGVALIVLAVAQAGDTLRLAEPLMLALAAVLLLAGASSGASAARPPPCWTWPCSPTGVSGAPIYPCWRSGPSTPARCCW